MAKRASFHHGDLRRALLDATLKLAGEKGAAGVSLREAARLAGVSQTAPYRHFADKDALLIAAAEEGMALLGEKMRAAALLAPDDPRRRLVELAGAYVQFTVDHPERFRLMYGQGSPAKGAAQRLQALAREAFQLFFVAIGECLARRLFRPADQKTLALELWSVGHGIATLVLERQTSHLNVTPHNVVPIARAATEAMIAGLGATAGRR